MMADLSFFQEAFDRHATDGLLGDPSGLPGYAYIRVSSSAQAEEGRSGLPRQISRVHEAAAREQICIPWDYVFADDHTGFQFHDRPELSRLRGEYASPNRRASTIVMEYLDRLSRNADWHQGFLLDEMKQNHIQPLFWKGFTSRVERAVMGAVSQDGMERSLEIMQEGLREKARSGRVTARHAAYGYMFVDAEGNPGPKARKETYYAPHPKEAEVIRLIFHKIGIEGMGTGKLCKYLEERLAPPGRYKHWSKVQICMYIRNPLYKGEFYANRKHRVVVPAKRQRPGEPIRMAERDIDRPREEWILVPVPPLVSEELWDAANAMLEKNSQMATRNAKSRYLLTGLVKCAECGYAYYGRLRRHRFASDPQMVSERIRYLCSGRTNREYHMIQAINCTQSQLMGHVLEPAVWSAVCQMITRPERLLEAMDAQLDDSENAGLNQQITFLKRQLAACEAEDNKLYRAFMADVFDEQEYADRRKLLKEKEATLEEELRGLSLRIISLEEVEADKALILDFAKQAREMGVVENASFDFKRQMLKRIVDKIVLNVREGWFRMEGRISGVWSLENPPVLLHPVPESGAIANTSAYID